jgi:hypothetical protein
MSFVFNDDGDRTFMMFHVCSCMRRAECVVWHLLAIIKHAVMRYGSRTAKAVISSAVFGTLLGGIKG